MAIMKFDPMVKITPWAGSSSFVPGFSSVRQEIDRIFDSFLRGGSFDDGSWGSFWSPSIDVIEKDDAYIVRAEVPGMSKDDVNISILNNVLTVRGEKKAKEEEKNSEFTRIERSYGSFQRSFALPRTVNANAVEAECKDGLLTITLPKLEEAKPKSIDVKVK